MDALEFLKEKQRMCNSFEYCGDCSLRHLPLYYKSNGECRLDKLPAIKYDITEKDIKEQISIVKEWSKEHPIKTNLDKFKEIFPNCNIIIQNKDVFYMNGDTDFWNQEYKEFK